MKGAAHRGCRRWLDVGVAALAAFASTCCIGTPTPLAPHLGGSVGVPHFGVQTGARELPVRGAGFQRFRKHGANYWGRPALVEALEAAAEAVQQEFPFGAPLVLGDLSARHGGKIPRHRSHRTGRDVDLLFYVTTPAGASVPSPGFVSLSSDGIAKDAAGQFYRLDVPRQWLLLKTLLRSPRVNVQWMFCSRALEALLIDYARARGEPDELVWHAETVLLQPGDSLPHDDHIHLRVACSPVEATRGCEGGGPYWEWLPQLPSLGDLSTEELAEIANADPLPDDDSIASQETPRRDGG